MVFDDYRNDGADGQERAPAQPKGRFLEYELMLVGSYKVTSPKVEQFTISIKVLSLFVYYISKYYEVPCEDRFSNLLIRSKVFFGWIRFIGQKKSSPKR